MKSIDGCSWKLNWMFLLLLLQLWEKPRLPYRLKYRKSDGRMKTNHRLNCFAKDLNRWKLLLILNMFARTEGNLLKSERELILWKIWWVNWIWILLLCINFMAPTWSSGMWNIPEKSSLTFIIEIRTANLNIQSAVSVSSSVSVSSLFPTVWP